MPLEDYFEALDRLKKGRPERVPAGTKITNDAVSIEAGRKKGSIKRSREMYRELIAVIDAAAIEQAERGKSKTRPADKLKEKVNDLQELLDAARNREMSHINEIFELRKKLAQLTGEKVLPINPRLGIQAS